MKILFAINRPKIRIISGSLLERRLIIQIPDELMILLVFFWVGLFGVDLNARP